MEEVSKLPLNLNNEFLKNWRQMSLKMGEGYIILVSIDYNFYVSLAPLHLTQQTHDMFVCSS